MNVLRSEPVGPRMDVVGLDEAGERWRDVVVGHRLDAAAIARVEDALSAGRALADPRERRAAVELGQLTQARPGRGRRRSDDPWWSRVMSVAIPLVFAAAVLACFVAGELGALAVGLLPVVPIWAAIEVWDRRRRRNLDRAIRLNTD